jgi:uncharacterized membrane protein
MENKALKFIQLISLILLMLVTGVFWGTWFTLTRSIETFSADEFIHIGKVIISNVAVPMRFLMPACILFMLISLWVYQPKNTIGFFLCITALIMIVITLIITLMVLVPIDNDIKHWTAETMPPGWELFRSKWKVYHELRTATSVISFACYAFSVLESK